MGKWSGRWEGERSTRAGTNAPPHTPNFASYDWQAVFAERRADLDLAAENKTLLEISEVLNNGDGSNEQCCATQPDTRNTIQRFREGLRQRSICSPETDRLVDFCVNATLEALQDNRAEVNQETVALLDDGTFNGGEIHPRPDPGALTVHQLYLELKKPVQDLFCLFTNLWH